MSKIKCPLQKPKWEPLFWDNLREQDLQITNCYSYAFNLVDKNPDPENKHKIQPGEISNTNKNNFCVVLEVSASALCYECYQLSEERIGMKGLGM